MNRNLIYIVVAVLAGCGIYFMLSTGTTGLLMSGSEAGDKRGSGASVAQVYSGVYVCDASSGCENTTRIALQEDTTLDIVATIDGQDLSLGQGTWGIGAGGALVLLIQNQASTTLPSSLIARKVTILKITNFSTKKPLFPGMNNPTFIRIPSDSTVDN